MKTKTDRAPGAHTQLPWCNQGTGQIFDQYGNLIAKCPAYGAGIVPADYVAPWHSSEANAELIVRAVNSHAALVALAERITRIPPDELSGWHREIIGMARAALAQARGEA